MLKPYVFAVCEKVILDAQGTASLIALFNKVEAQLVSSADPLPANAVAPFPWAIFTSWEMEPDDAEKKFLQVFEILFPDGSTFQEHRVEFVTPKGKTHHQIEARFTAFPIGQQGQYTVTMRLEQDGVKVFESPSIKINVVLRPAASLSANP